MSDHTEHGSDPRGENPSLPAHHRGDDDSLLQALIRAQWAQGGIAESSMARIAHDYGTSIGEVRGMVHFYHLLDDTPGATHDIRVSDNIVDHMAGSLETMEVLSRELGVTPGDPRNGGPVRLDSTSCIGLSDQGPGLLVNGLSMPRVTTARAMEIAQRVREGIPVQNWPREWFQVASNIRHRDSLLDEPDSPGQAVQRAQAIGAARILDEIEASGLRGRGGAGFPTARKWRLCAGVAATPRVVVCNADEGEPGTFKDRVLLAHKAQWLIDGMAICAMTIGADLGLIYLRGEYRYLLEDLRATIARQRDRGILPPGFEIHVHLGAGAYICGEESALIESLEGKRGIPRIRPPFPVTAGYRGRPTVVNNVETLIAAAMIVANGPEWLRDRGTAESPGTRLLSISGDCTTPGIYEIPHGIAIAEVLEMCGARNTGAVQVGGPSGTLVPPAQFQRRIAYEDCPTGGSFMIFDDSRDLVDVVRNFTTFFTHESCGFCTPCRVGGALLGKRLAKVSERRATRTDLERMSHFAQVMREASHCGLGQTASNPVVHLMQHFPEAIEGHLTHTGFEPAFDLDDALEDARRLTGRDDAGAHIKRGGV